MAKNSDTRTVYVVRMNIGRPGELVEYGLRANRIALGYSEVPGLIEIADNHYAVREALKKTYSWNNRKAGKSAGELRRFLHGMKQHDLVLVPHGNDIYLAKVAGPLGFDKDMPAGAGYYRDVEWLNPKAPFPRRGLDSAIQHHVGEGTRNTLRELNKALLPRVKALAERNVDTDKTFQDNLRERLEKDAIDVLENRNMNPKGFEYFLCDLFKRRFGAIGAVRGGRADKGADIVLDIPPPHDLLASKVVIQAKYHVDGRKTGKKAVDQILEGMNKEQADLGIVITTGEFDDTARTACDEANPEDHRASVLLWDGQRLAKVIVESGLELTRAGSLTEIEQ